MEQKINSVSSADTKDDSITNVEVAVTVHHHSSNTNVGSSASLSQSQIEEQMENDFDEDSDWDDDYEDYMEAHIEETLRNCSCGAYQLGDDSQLYLVADCCC